MLNEQTKKLSANLKAEKALFSTPTGPFLLALLVMFVMDD